MSDFIAKNKPMIGLKTVAVDGQEFALDWGNSHLVVKGGETEIKIENSRLARMLGAMTLPAFISAEVRRNS